MSDDTETIRGRSSGAVEPDALAAIKERMMSQCAKMMPHMMEMCGGAQNDEGEAGANAGSPCSPSSDTT